jgi:hypothetical protein
MEYLYTGARLNISIKRKIKIVRLEQLGMKVVLGH